MNRNENLAIRVTGRHVSVTDAIRDYAQRKIEAIGLDFPRVIEAHVILDVEKYRHRCEIVLTCANHIVIEAHEETDSMYASIALCVDKLARQMRKYKTRIQRHQPRAKKHQSVHIDEHVLSAEGLEIGEESQPTLVHKERLEVKPMYPDEAVLQMELSPRPFLVFLNATTGQVNVLHRRKSGHYGLIEASLPRASPAP